MKHIKPKSRENAVAMAQDGVVCGWLFVPSNTKCVDSSSPLADILKRVPVE